MDVLIYAQNYHPERFGVGRVLGEVGAHLEQSGHRVRVVTAVPHYPQWRASAPFKAWAYHREERSAGSIVRCPILLKRPMRGLWRLVAPASFAVTSLPVVLWAMLRWRPDIVLCVEPTLFAAPVAVALGRITRARTILYVQDLEVEAAFAVGHLKNTAARRAALAIERRVLCRFDRIIAVSARIRDAIERKGVDPARIDLIRNWVDLDAIRPSSGLNSYREEHGWPDALTIALYAGSIGAKQALHVALDAAALLAHRHDILFVIAGDGPDKPGLTARYGHLGNIVFLPPQPEHRLSDLLHLASVHLLMQSRGVADLVLPSKLGGMLASGKPILATADAGSELHDVLHGTAVLVPAGDSAAVARELVIFAAGHGRHPAVRDSRALAATLDRSSALAALTDVLETCAASRASRTGHSSRRGVFRTG